MDDSELIPLSALQHYLFCPRQCALIHVDGLWAENRLTVEGAILHSRVDTPGHRRRRTAPERAGVRVLRSLPLLSRVHGLVGKADCVEIPVDDIGDTSGPPKPVEHKRGSPKRIDADRVQLCAQALCLEEMMGVRIEEGELFYNKTRRRERVSMGEQLRSRTRDTILAVREQLRTNRVPLAEYGAKCRNCSLINLCMPKGVGASRDPVRYLARSLEAALQADTGEAGS